LFDLGTLAATRGKLKEAQRYLRNAQKIYKKFNDEPGIGYCLAQESLIAFTKGNTSEAWDYLLQAIQIYQNCKDNDLKEMIRRRLGDFLEISEYHTVANRILSSKWMGNETGE
jgi:tetratricopeptide (TPR) repeat protein